MSFPMRHRAIAGDKATATVPACLPHAHHPMWASGVDVPLTMVPYYAGLLRNVISRMDK